jgi:hypothetical protein
VAGRADAGIAEVQPPSLAPHHGGQLRQAGGREVAPRDDRHRHLVDHADGLQRGRVETEVAVERRDGRLRQAAEQDGVAVRPRRGDTALADRPARAGRVLHHHRLAEIRPERGRNQTRDHVGRATRRESDDHGDRACREGRPLRGRAAGDPGSEREAEQAAPDDAGHAGPPVVPAVRFAGSVRARKAAGRPARPARACRSRCRDASRAEPAWARR